jgi:hypothetical protein
MPFEAPWGTAPKSFSFIGTAFLQNLHLHHAGICIEQPCVVEKPAPLHQLPVVIVLHVAKSGRVVVPRGCLQPSNRRSVQHTLPCQSNSVSLLFGMQSSHASSTPSRADQHALLYKSLCSAVGKNLSTAQGLPGYWSSLLASLHCAGNTHLPLVCALAVGHVNAIMARLWTQTLNPTRPWTYQ